ncbi:MAG: hypothetical protein ACUVUD_05455 [bacterium]
MKVFWICFFVVLTSPLLAQQEFGCICSTNVRYATAPNNSHKLAYRSEGLDPREDTVTLVFQSSESIYITTSGYEGSPWSRPQPLYPGHNPGINTGRNGDRQLVWEMVDTASGVQNIFYRDLEYRMMPLNVSQSSVECQHPDVCGDSAGVAHIVWVEAGEVWYRKADQNGLIGERFRVSEGVGGVCDWPAIEEFNEGVTVVWQSFDSARSSPYLIVRRRQVNGVWQPEEVLMESTLPLSHPSLDFGFDGESFSAGWERSVGGNFETYFYGGNGGGYSTPGTSTAPVLSTIGSVWSYLFWEENSAGGNDIFTHFYYFMSGWYSMTSVRNWFSIDEPMYGPSCLGALLVWTQGETAPYKVMWAFFDYPIAAAESPTLKEKRQREISPFARSVLFVTELNKPSSAAPVLFDQTGKKVLNLKSGVNDVSRLSPGVYFVRGLGKGRDVEKVVILR